MFGLFVCPQKRECSMVHKNIFEKGTSNHEHYNSYVISSEGWQHDNAAFGYSYRCTSVT